ncbi:AlpA family transcriptional regulator [uncultured Photobacterium sp.]|uniref:helix-turn-helix transcriptional regulator n=1 Tax=uncultured Photobacterium sp. TaxID=173973 RepID=UPI00260E3C85|nr:AlpA family transcriptional regulator [uncultured Photobacterium sp.]
MSVHPPSSFNIIRLPEVLTKTGISRACLYKQIQHGLFPSQISLGYRSVGWLEREIDAVLKARVAGYTNEQIKALVSEMLDARKLSTEVSHDS